MKRYILIVLTAAAACGKKAPTYEAFKSDAGFSLEAPKEWPREAGPAGKPAVVTEFIGDVQPQDEGVALGAVLTVTKLSRKDAAASLLKDTKALFPDDAATAAESKPYSRDYEHGGPSPMHQNAAPVPMRVEGKVFRTADAFYVVELRGVRSKFDANRPVLERALATFKPS
jgi:hypothetical protein